MRLRNASQSDHRPALAAGRGADHRPVTYTQRPGYQGTGLIYTRLGGARFRSRGQEFVSQTYDLVLLRSSEPVEFGPNPPRYVWGTYWTHFDIRPEWLEWLNWPEVIPGVFRIQLEDAGQRKRLVAAFDHLCEVVRRDQPFHTEFCLNALEVVLLHCRIANPKEGERAMDERILRVTDFISKNLHQHVTLADLARAACLSPSHCEELFKEQIGVTPFRYLEMQRMRRARVMLARTSKPINQVAMEVGFADPAYFTKRFRHNFRQSPRAYRKQFLA